MPQLVRVGFLGGSGGGGSDGFTFSDNFNRANEDLDASPNWTLQSGTSGHLRVNSNICNKPAGTYSPARSTFSCPDIGTANMYVEIETVNTVNWLWNPCVRMTDNDNYFGLEWSSPNLLIRKRQAGSISTVGFAATTVSVGDVFRLEVSGNAFTARKNGGVVTSGSDSFNNTVTTAGLLASGDLGRDVCDNFVAGSL